jgi:outer membrane lipoprotein LolB
VSAERSSPPAAMISPWSPRAASASTAAHAELASRLGFDPPLSALRYWVLGVPDPAQPASESLDAAQQRLSALTQEGWHVEYQSYGSAGGETLPARMTLRRDQVRVRLLVDDWQR